nr:cysteine-rich protein [Hyaloperonospora arabidopsidis]
MKLSTVFTPALVAVVCLFQSTAAEGQSSIHVRVHVEESPLGVCYKKCEAGSYCPNGTNTCLKPTGTQCFHPDKGMIVEKGCDDGFVCNKEGKCVYK